MKKITLALLLVLVCAAAAFGFAKKGYIPECDPLVYRGLSVTAEGVNVTIVNKGDRAVVFHAVLMFLDARRQELGDAYIEKTTIAPGGEAVFKGLFLKGDYKLCRKAESLRWSVYQFDFE